MGNGIVAQSEESITPNDTLPASSLRQQILHVRFGWRLTFPSLWRLTVSAAFHLLPTATYLYIILYGRYFYGLCLILTNYNKTVLYTGVTNNLQRRLYEHRMGINDSFTKRYHVYYLVYYETISNIKDAIHREKSIKGFSRNKKEVLINSINPEWKDLSKEWL